MRGKYPNPQDIELAQINGSNVTLLVERVEHETSDYTKKGCKIKADSTRHKFTNQELDRRAFITAQVEGNKVVYSIILTNAKDPLSREEVESHVEGELSKKSLKPN